MSFKSIALVSLVLVFENTAIVQAQSGSDGFFQLASKTQKYVLLVFAGSDWCAPCIRFEKDVLKRPEFSSFAESHLVIFTADFPQRKTLSKEIVDQNEKLAERYNPKGLFPNILLIRSDGSLLSTLPYNGQSAVQFINEIKQRLPDE
jgi:thiamine biosynthesis lipoprotein